MSQNLKKWDCHALRARNDRNVTVCEFMIRDISNKYKPPFLKINFYLYISYYFHYYSLFMKVCIANFQSISTSIK